MGISPFTVVLVLLLGVLIFGKNLPEVAKQLGAGLLEFKKGLNEMKEISSSRSSSSSSPSPSSVEEVESESTEKHEVYGTKFEPPSSL